MAIDDGREAPDMSRAGGGYNALLGQMCAQDIDRLRALGNQKSRVR